LASQVEDTLATTMDVATLLPLRQGDGGEHDALAT
jgi:hypothetical protein